MKREIRCFEYSSSSRSEWRKDVTYIMYVCNGKRSILFKMPPHLCINEIMITSVLRWKRRTISVEHELLFTTSVRQNVNDIYQYRYLQKFLLNIKSNHNYDECVWDNGYSKNNIIKNYCCLELIMYDSFMKLERTGHIKARVGQCLNCFQ